MAYYIIFDIVILVVLALFAWRGFSRGLVLSLCGLLAVIIAFVGAGFAARTVSPIVAAALEPRFAVAIEAQLDAGIADAAPGVSPTPVPTGSPEAGGQTNPDLLQDALNALKDMGFYQSLVDTVNDAVEKGMNDVAAGAAASVAAAIAQSVAYMVIFAVAFFLILIVWRLISHALDLVARFPGLHFLNKTLGAAFGLLKACILLFLAAWLLQYAGQLIPEEAVQKTYLLNFFMETNPFALLMLV